MLNWIRMDSKVILKKVSIAISILLKSEKEVLQ